MKDVLPSSICLPADVTASLGELSFALSCPPCDGRISFELSIAGGRITQIAARTSVVQNPNGPDRACLPAEDRMWAQDELLDILKNLPLHGRAELDLVLHHSRVSRVESSTIISTRWNAPAEVVA